MNGNGIIDDQDRQLQQPMDKKYYGGLINSFQYKGFEFSFLIQFSHQPGTPYLRDLAGKGVNQPVSVLKRWQKPGDITKYAKFTQDYSYNIDFNNLLFSSYNFENASFARLKTVSVSYTLPASWFGKALQRSAKFYVQGQNLYTLTNSTNLDPETGSSVPPLRVVTMGFQVKL